MKPQTRGKIAQEILRAFFDINRKRKPFVTDSDLRGMKHCRNLVHQVKNDLLKAGIIERAKKGYILGRGVFERRDEVLGFVNLLRSGDPMRMEIGAKNLRRICGADTVSKEKTFDEFIQTANLEALSEGLEIVEVTRVDEVWKLFIEVLNESQRFDWLLTYLTEAILKVVRLIRTNEHMDLLNKEINNSPLGTALVSGVRKAILDTVRSETYVETCFEKNQGPERVVIQLFLILRELDMQNEMFITTLKELLSLPQRGTDFSRLELPDSAVEQTSEEQAIPDIWRAQGGYTDLFNQIYRILENTKNKSMRTLLQEWAIGKDANLSRAAWIFYDYLLEDKHLKKADWPNETTRTSKTIDEHKILPNHDIMLVRGILAVNESLPQFVPQNDFDVGDLLTGIRKNLKLRSSPEMWPYALQHLKTGYTYIYSVFEKCCSLLEAVQHIEVTEQRRARENIAREFPYSQSTNAGEDSSADGANSTREESEPTLITTKEERFKLENQTNEVRFELENQLTELILKVLNDPPLKGNCNICQN